jgi:hypothetical protein
MKCERGKCFECIRENTEYEWAYKCSTEELSKFYKVKFDRHTHKKIVTSEFKSEEHKERLLDLIEDVFADSLDLFDSLGMRMKRADAVVIGDSVARLFLFVSPRSPKLISKYHLESLLPVIRRASIQSLSAHTLTYMLDGNLHSRDKRFPRCWMNMTMERAERNDGNRPRVRNIRRNYQVDNRVVRRTK